MTKVWACYLPRDQHFTLIYMCVPWLLAKEITAISRKQGPPYHVVGGPFVLLISTMARDGRFVLVVLLFTADHDTGCPIPVVLIVNQHSHKTESVFECFLLNLAMKRPLHQMTVVKVM